MVLPGYLLAAILNPGTFVIILILGFIRFNKKLIIRSIKVINISYLKFKTKVND